MKDYTYQEMNQIVYDNIDVIIVASAKEDTYRTVKCTESMAQIIAQEGSYKALIEQLLFHLSVGNARISDEYQVFLPMMSEFKGKFAQKVSLEYAGAKHFVQILVYPIQEREDEYVIVLCELGEAEVQRDDMQENKVKTIQETYLFSMYVDLNKDLTSSINVTEISNDDLHYDVKYSEWRNMIINMFLPEDQEMFLERSDPEYLRAHLKPAKTLSFDCQMMNLEGEFIWVKLIFSRTDTTRSRDFCFVFMVQNIHEDSILLFEQLKKFEKLASRDALTGVLNRRYIESELNNAIDDAQQNEQLVSLMMFDIDYFKKINDTYGHSVGDEVLKSFVDSINDQLQDQDIKMGRWGGEEFVCVCYNLDVDALQKLAEETREFVANQSFETIGKMTCSIGLTMVEKDDDFDTAYKRLDEALYDAKSSGRNCVKLHMK